MKKLLKILSGISFGTIAVSMMAVMLCYVFRGPLVELFFHRGTELPAVVPASDLVLLVGQLGGMIWLCIFVGDQRFGIWSELLAVGWLGVVLPGICWAVTYVQTALLGRAMGAEYLLAHSYMSGLWSYATMFNGVAVALALVTCGLSMAGKRNTNLHQV